MAIEDTEDIGWTDVVTESLRLWASPERAVLWNELLDETCVPIALWGAVQHVDGNEYLGGFYIEPAFNDVQPITWYGVDPAEAITHLTMILGARRARGDESMTPPPPLGDPGARLNGIGLLLRETHEVTGVQSTSIYLADESPEMYVARFCGTDHVIVDHAPAPDIDADLTVLVTDPATVYRPVHFALHDMLAVCVCDPEYCTKDYGGPGAEALLAAVDRLVAGAGYATVSAIMDPDNRVN